MRGNPPRLTRAPSALTYRGIGVTTAKRFSKQIITLLSNPARLVFFTGAGISRNPPSSLPLARDVKLQLIKAICNGDDNPCISHFYRLHKHRISTLLQNISMESIFEILRVRSQLNVIKLVTKLFGATEPNDTHTFLARLLKAGCTVVTTNFDLLIEEALRRESARRPRCDPAQLCRRIFHIHGSVKQPQSIIGTLRRVGQALISADTEIALKKVLGNRTVVFVGWSDRDIDIMPALFGSGMKEVYWIEHSKRKSSMLCWSDQKVKGSREPVDKLVATFHGTKYMGDTDGLVGEIWRAAWSDAPLGGLQGNNTSWKEQMKPVKGLRWWERGLILVEVLERIDREKRLPLELIRGLQTRAAALGETERAVSYELSCKRSVCERIVCRHKQAISSAKQGLKRMVAVGEDLSWYIELRNDIGSAYDGWAYSCRRGGRLKEAMRRHVKAVRIMERNIKELNEHLRRCGDVGGKSSFRILVLLDKAQVHTNLGSCYLGLCETGSRCSMGSSWVKTVLEKAERNYAEGIRIHLELGQELRGDLGSYNDIKLGDLYNNIANVYSRESEREKAQEYYTKCLEVKRKSGDVRGTKRLLEDYLSFIEGNDLKVRNVEVMRAKRDALESAFVEYPISSTHLLYYKRKLSGEEDSRA